MTMKKSMNFSSNTLIGYFLIIGMIICIVTTNSFVLNLIEKAVEIKLNPFNITDWIWIFIGS